VKNAPTVRRKKEKEKEIIRNMDKYPNFFWIIVGMLLMTVLYAIMSIVV